MDRKARDQRIVLTVFITGWSVAIAYVIGAHHRALPSDFAQTWAAARFLASGLNPYELIGPQGQWYWPFPLLYPLPAAIAALPVAPLPHVWAELTFVGISTALLVWILTRDTVRNPQLWVFTSAAWLFVLHNVQWSPLMIVAALTPSLGFLLACKPSIGAAMFLAYPSKRSAIGIGVFTLLTVALWPWWVRDWLAALPAATHVAAPLTFTAGPLVLLALVDWRNPQARLLVALAAIPHTVMLYEAVPLFLLVRRWWEGLCLSVLTAAAFALSASQWTPDYEATMAANGQIAVLLLYLPCTALVVGRRVYAWKVQPSRTEPALGAISVDTGPATESP